MNWNLKRLNLECLGLVTIVFLAAGCTTTVPAGKYDVLAESSQNILNGTSETYTRIEKLQRRFAVETATDIPLGRDTFLPVIDVNGKSESFDLAPELHFRESALQVLVKYSLVLQALAKPDFEGDVDKAAEEFAGSLKSLAGTTAPNNDSAQKASGILATVVDVIGREIIREKRLEALKTVMDSAQSDIEKLAQLIVGSNGKLKAVVGKMLDEILAHRDRERPPIDTIQRVDFDSEVSLITSEAKEINNAIDGLSAAIAKVPSAHAEIRKMLDGEAKGLDALQHLVKDVQRIDKFYRSLK